WQTWAAGVVAVDFAYYWFHRMSHDVRLLWAAHVNHHSSEHYNLSTALRQSWTTPFTGLPFYWPLALLGFDPMLILTLEALDALGYMFAPPGWSPDGSTLTSRQLRRETDERSDAELEPLAA